MLTQNSKSSVQEAPAKASSFYPFIIRKGERFCVYLPEWGLSGEGDSLEEAYRQFELNKMAFEERAAKFGLATVSPDPYPVLRKGDVLRELTLFFMKTATAVIAVILVVVLLLPNVSAAFRHQVTTLVSTELKDPRFWAIQLPSRINERLDRLDHEEEEKMLSEWNKLILRTTPLWGPFKCQ